MSLPFAGRTVAILVAHPDDEILGAAAQLRSMARISLIHLSDGVPSRRAARAHGCATAAAYRAARSAELDEALRTAIDGAAVPVERFCLGVPDGLASFYMGWIAASVADLLGQLRPDYLLTHPYEGGHPDHDAAAWSARVAADSLDAPPPVWEMPSYHAAAGHVVQGDFIDRPGCPAVCVDLSSGDAAVRHAALACFATQTATLQPFPRNRECFRPAPRYDFAVPPHPGRLMYESRIRSMRGAQWRRLAAGAQRWLQARSSHPASTRPGLPRPVRSATSVAATAAWSMWIAR